MRNPMLGGAALVGAVVLVVVAVVFAVDDRVMGDTRCGPFWSQQFRDPCFDWNRNRTIVVVGAAVIAIGLLVVSARSLARRD